SARRGPTFLITATSFIALCIVRRRQPHWSAMVIGGTGLALVLLLQATFRDAFHLRGAFLRSPFQTVATFAEEMQERRKAGLERDIGGSEFVFGVSTVLN